MKVVICADIHLDGLFPETKNDPAKASLRARDARASFTRVMDTVRTSGTHLLLIAGDLFDANHVTADTVAFLKQSFLSIPDTYVFISPGNNDPATKVSPYVKEEWPENVYIFTDNLEAVELAIPETGECLRVYGAGFKSHRMREAFLNVNRLPELDPAYINILLMHASLDENSACNPISEELLDQCGFDFCALGHQHNQSGVVALSNTFYAYPGTCETRSFEASGGILAGSLSHQYQDLRMSEVSSRKYITGTLDITGMDSHEEILRAIQANYPPDESLYRITLTGIPHPLLKFSLKSIQSALTENYFYIRLRAKFSADTENARPLKTGLLQDYFLNEASRESAVGTTDPEILRLAVQYGLSALSGQGEMENVFTREEFWSNED